MKYLAPIPKQFVDQNGLPLSNGKVHVYISGDTQYANVYQDADGEELMPNPARLDSNGAWLGFVTAGVPLDYVVEDKDGNVQFEYEKVVAGGGGEGGSGPIYIQESHTSSDSNVTVTPQKTKCTFDSNLNDFTGELHVRFQNSGQAATVTFYVNNEYYDKAVSTLSVMSGMTHLMVPLSVKSGSLRTEVTFATASTPSSVKFDLAGYNLGTGGGTQVQSDWSQTDSNAADYIKNKPDMEKYAKLADLASVAFSGNYSDLLDKPNLASVALTGDYEDLRNLPSIPSLSRFYHSQQVIIKAGVASSPERYNLDAFVPAGKQFVGTLTIKVMHTSQNSGAYQYTIDVPGASMRCIFGTYPAIPQSGHTIGMSVENSGNTQFQLYFELSGTFESQNVDIYINGIVF